MGLGIRENIVACSSFLLTRKWWCFTFQKERKKAKKAKKEKERGQRSPDSDRRSCDEERERDEDRKSSDRSERMRSGEERRLVILIFCKKKIFLKYIVFFWKSEYLKKNLHCRRNEHKLCINQKTFEYFFSYYLSSTCKDTNIILAVLNEIMISDEWIKRAIRWLSRPRRLSRTLRVDGTNDERFASPCYYLVNHHYSTVTSSTLSSEIRSSLNVKNFKSKFHLFSWSISYLVRSP